MKKLFFYLSLLIVFSIHSTCYSQLFGGTLLSSSHASNGVLAQIGNEGDSPNTVPSVVTTTQLASVSGVTGVVPANEAAYQAYIDANPNSFSAPATVAELNAMIAAVNASQSVLAQIGNEGDSPNTVPSVVTVSQINTISPAITGAIIANQAAYQAYIDANPSLFSAPATVAEVQAMIAAVNASQSVLAQIGNEGDSPNTVPSVVTVSQINTISPAITGAILANQAAYQAYIDANPSLFSAPATVAEVQAMINAVNNAASSGGTSLVSAYSCSTASAGTMTAGTAVSGVTQTITATVTTNGTYNITATANGVTFTGTGTFAGTGNQDIVLTATGTPTAVGTNTFTLNTTPNCSFTRDTTDPSTGGTGIVSSYTCSTASSGTLYEGVDPSGVTQTITANVTAVGTYNITATANNVVFAASGTFTSTGSQNIVLTATGAPGLPGTNTFTLDTTPNCSFNRDVVNNLTGGTSGFTISNCSAGNTGTMIAGTPVSGVTQKITISVWRLGTYNLSTTVNGVTFAASGTLTSSGTIQLFLTGSGTPINSGNFSFPMVPAATMCSFTRTVYDASTNGSGVVSTYSCSTASAGTMTAGTAVSGVTQTITATVTTIGTYNITATANGVTFTGTGTFAGTGNQNVVLTATGTPTAAGTSTFTLNTTPNCSFTRTVAAAYTVPATITLAQNRTYMIASVYDQDYLPYTTPSGAATTSTLVAANGSNETVTVNVQGTITTAGVALKIPVTATGSDTLPAFSQTITIPASMTEDGISRDLTLSWPAQAYTVATTTINATIAAVGGTLNAKKLDINAGIGNDALGVLMGQFTYPYNNAGNTTTYSVRDIAGIPDKMFGLPDNNSNSTTHMMLYFPILAADGNLWLNNNLGADYSNMNKSSFNPVQQATSATDHLAFGSLFQWGRKPDGHELITWTSYYQQTPVNGTTSTNDNSPTNALFITEPNSPYDWRTSQEDSLWANEASANNPCPVSFRVPTAAEYTVLINASNITNNDTSYSSIMKFPSVGIRSAINGTYFGGISEAYYWTSSVSSTNVIGYQTTTNVANTNTINRGVGSAIRCIKD